MKAVELATGEDDLFTGYGYVTCGNASAGLVPFRANVIACVPTTVHAYGGDALVLVYERVDLCPRTTRLPWCSMVDTGALKHYAVEDWAAQVAQPDTEFSISRVDIDLMCYDEVHGDKFLVKGLASPASHETITVAAAEAAAAARSAKGRSKGKPTVCKTAQYEVNWDDVVPKSKSRKMQRPEGSAESFWSCTIR